MGGVLLTRRGLLEAASSFGVAQTGFAPHSLIGTHAKAQTLARLPNAQHAESTPTNLEVLPGKKPLIKLTYRPPNYETPIDYFGTALTPNDAFFVRYHLSDIPQVDAKNWTLSVGGDGASGRVEFDLDALRRLPAVEVTAVCQCSGNRRGLFRPKVPGVLWGYGAMGCARWKGARLKDVLDRAGLKKEAQEIVFDGADKGVVDRMPDFIKSIPLWKAMEETTLVAYEMNGQPLPHWNGFPARLVVPGWTATYWVKHITSINVATKPFDGFWMKTAYRVPLGKFPVVSRFISQETAVNTPITEIMVNSLITSLRDGALARSAVPLSVAGIAWDGGYGIRSVEVSVDSGRTWVPAVLGANLGKFAFRTWSYRFAPKPGRQAIIARAANAIGQTQTTELIPNPAGYNHNVMHAVTIFAS